MIQSVETSRIQLLPDLALLTNSNTNGETTVREHNERKLVFDFIVSRFPNFISEDVINSKSFISSTAQSLPQLTEFIDVQKTYMPGQLRNPGKTDLWKLVEEINSDIKNLNEKFQEASLITIDVSSGTDQLYVASAQKQILLTGITALTLNIRSKIQNGDVLRKMKKRISQQKQRNCSRLKEMQQPETILKCYNSEVSWEDTYSKLENGQINTNRVHSGKIRDFAARIESSFVFQVSALETASTKEKDDIIHPLLTNFPIMRAT